MYKYNMYKVKTWKERLLNKSNTESAIAMAKIGEVVELRAELDYAHGTIQEVLTMLSKCDTTVQNDQIKWAADKLNKALRKIQ